MSTTMPTASPAKFRKNTYGLTLLAERSAAQHRHLAFTKFLCTLELVSFETRLESNRRAFWQIYHVPLSSRARGKI
jgi:hypothetical protein